MKILIATDAWTPQVNGVVTTLTSLVSELSKDHEVKVIEPSLFATLPIPVYPEIRASIDVFNSKKILKDFQPDAIHISTEGPIGIYLRNYLVRKRIPFTTAVHTKFPDYLKDLMGLPTSITNEFLKWFHSGAARTLVNTPSHQRELESIGIQNLKIWNRAIDKGVFRPLLSEELDPYYLYVGRVSREKNLEAFFSLDLDLPKVVVGEGPQLKEYKKKFPDVNFIGYKFGDELAEIYSNARVKVFPSLTDTFGLVMLEANACGTPVAAYPVTGPIDVISNGINGYYDQDLKSAIEKACSINRASSFEFADQFSWSNVAKQFLDTLIRL
ncbi:MAG: glycosyltransferase family 4 protein [Gammaproteobacteria bacterium]